MPSGTRSNPNKGDEIISVIDFIKSSEFQEIVKSAVAEVITNETKYLCDKILQLEQKIVSMEKKIEVNSKETISNVNIDDINLKNNDIVEIPTYVNAVKKSTVQKTYVERKSPNKNKVGEIQGSSKLNVNVLPKDDAWKTVNRRKRLPIVHGSSNENTSIKAATKYAHFHAFRLEPTLNSDDLEKYLRDMKIEEVKCLKISSKHPDEYSSFKVTVPARFEDTILCPTTWPKDVCVNRFLTRLWKENIVK